MKTRKAFEATLDDLVRFSRQTENSNWNIRDDAENQERRVRAELLEWFDETQAALVTLAVAAQRK